MAVIYEVLGEDVKNLTVVCDYCKADHQNESGTVLVKFADYEAMQVEMRAAGWWTLEAHKGKTMIGDFCPDCIRQLKEVCDRG